MRNKLTFFGALFIALLIGKIGNVGTLGQISWVKVAIPLAADMLCDYYTVMDRKYFIIHWLWEKVETRRVMKVLRNAAKNSKP